MRISTKQERGFWRNVFQGISFNYTFSKGVGILLTAFSLCLSSDVYANRLPEKARIGSRAQSEIKVSGTVKDAAGNILPGVSVFLKSKPSIGTTTNLNGQYVLDVPPTGVLVFTLVGYATQEVNIAGRTSIDVTLSDATSEVDEVVVTAFGQRQAKKDVVGAVTSVNVRDLKVPSSNLTTALQGRAGGVISFQRSGEPGMDNADFFVRGVATFGVNQRPLILVDNMEVSIDDLARIPWDDLESFTILKDATATSVYGSRGANGVILVTTKVGREGPPRLNFRAEQRISQATQQLDIADPVTWMIKNREAEITRDPARKGDAYSLQKIDSTAMGIDPLRYPAVDWMDFMTKDITTTQNYNLGISGGGQIANYNVSANLTQDNGLLKFEPINNFNSNVRFRVYNIRSNVGLNITKSTNLMMRTLANIQDYNGPPISGQEAFARILRSNPVAFLPKYEPFDNQAYITHPMFGNVDGGDFYNAYAQVVRGYKERRRSNISIQAELNQDLSGILTEGLKFQGLFNLSRNAFFEQSRVYNPFYYVPVTDVSTGQVTSFQNVNPNTGREFLDFNINGRDQQAILYGEGRFSYVRKFDDIHGISSMVVGTFRDRIVNPSGIDNVSFLNSLAYRNLSLSGNVTYNYKEKYYALFAFGYNGSERFDKNYRWGFFPSVGFSWNVTSEEFMQGLGPAISNLKLRFSHGTNGNDDIASTRFFYLSDVSLNSPENSLRVGYPNNSTIIPGVSTQRYANPEVRWEVSRQTNYGLDASLYNGAVTFSADYYNQFRYNIVQSRAAVPASNGYAAAILANVGQYKSRGIDFEAAYNRNFSANMWLQARGTFTYATGEYVKFEEPTYPHSYLSNIGLHARQTRGYVAERLFIDDAEVANSPSQEFGGAAVMGGDIKYVDLNKDGVINSNDMIAIGYPTSPEINYGFGFSMGYKNIDFSLFFSGIGRTSLFINPTTALDLGGGIYGTAPFGSQTAPNALLQAYADSHWSEDSQDIYALYPRLSIQPVCRQ